MMPSKLAAVTLLATMPLLVACSQDDEARKLLADMTVFQDALQAAMRDSPDEAGIAKAEALVLAQSPALHARYVDLAPARLSPGTLTLIPTRCAVNRGAAEVGRDYVMNGLEKRGEDATTRAELRARIEKLLASLDRICGR